MTKATRPLHNRLAVVFDFDETLVPESLDALLAALGHDPRAFREEHILPLQAAGWELHFAQFHALIEESRRRPPRERITRDFLAEVGASLEPFEGVAQMFGRLRRCARDVADDVEVEFYVISAGFADIQRATSIAPEFTAIYGSEFAFDDATGEIVFPKQVLTFPEKESYMLSISKGLPLEGADGPEDAWRHVDEEDLHVPIDQVVYVGDGASDMPVFSLMQREGGIALGVLKPHQSAKAWEGQKQMRPDRRVLNLAEADFRDGSELMRSLEGSVQSICKRLDVMRLGEGE
jgi:phosphoserine phosphatase